MLVAPESTDEGVAFIVTVGKKTMIYEHSGFKLVDEGRKV